MDGIGEAAICGGVDAQNTMDCGDIPASPAVEIEPMMVGLNVMEGGQKERELEEEEGPVSACILLLEHRQRQHFFVPVVINMHQALRF
jgi:hypothetical protein